MRQMRQPKKSVLREQLAIAAARIIELETENAALREGRRLWRVAMPATLVRPSLAYRLLSWVGVLR